ncbi:MAG: hypothetical protein IJT58_04325, partial [Synergistaceae bacterium]|nr:hypothetical protein [Synergistaceae bacterium]
YPANVERVPTRGPFQVRIIISEKKFSEVACCDKIGTTLRGVEPYLKLKTPGLAEQPVPKCDGFEDKVEQPVKDDEEDDY